MQDKDLRTLLEIKPPEQQPAGELRLALAPAGGGGGGIIVPTVTLLPPTEQPDLLVREQEPPVVQRMQQSEQPDLAGTSAAALAASAAWRSAELAAALDPPYIRYVQVRCVRILSTGCCIYRQLWHASEVAFGSRRILESHLRECARRCSPRPTT